MKNVWQSELDHCWSWLAGKPELAGPWAVGVSGGADSLALVFLLQEWAKEKQADFTALTVQHGLRPEAEAEAQYVARLMKAHGIKHHILYWKGEKPVSGVESAARTARYELMYDWCRQNGVGALLIAHHKRDQAETFLMRLQRGSGVDDLSAMAPVSKWKNLYVVRPLLQTDPECLRAYLEGRKISWVEDASNDCDDFLRVKIRKMLPALEADIGLSRERLCNTALEMARVRDYLEKQTAEFVATEAGFAGNCGVSLKPEALGKLHEEIGLRVLSALLKKVGGKIYPPCLEEVERLWEAVRKPDFRGRTLGDCEIFLFRKKIWIIRELKNTEKLPRKEWENFVALHPEYAKSELPYKLRRVLYVAADLKS